ncbi:IS66 family insertion sequence element accessory protein TnpA [Chitinophaga agri]
MKEIVSNYPCSGKTIKEYCAANKIKVKTFYYWLCK